MFTIAGQATSPLEIVAFASGLASVWLARQMHIANWPAGIVSVLCFAVVFHDAKLYADALLQLIFVVLCVYGWWKWWHAPQGGKAMPVTRTPLREGLPALVMAAVGIAVVAWLLDNRTDSPLPLPDASVLVISLLATWAQARGRIECWWAWIVVDLISIPMYWSRALPLTAMLYFLFLLICFGGLHSWHKRLKETGAAA
jgi:nicotinamide mononucleotide transporter